MKLQKTTLVIGLLFSGIVSGYSQNKVTYKIVFESSWQANNHVVLPNVALPDNAHFSPLAVATHKTADLFWKLGEPTSSGMTAIAEFGSTGTFEGEVNAEILNGNADQVVIGPDMFYRDNETSITIDEIEIDRDFPFITMASMLAPSPDWFMGVNSLSVLDDNGDWKNEIVMDMFPYDGGTRIGNQYQLGGAMQGGVIANYSGMGQFNTSKIGTLRITAVDLSVLSVDQFTENSKLNVKIFNRNNIITINKSKRLQLSYASVFDFNGRVVKNMKVNQREKNIEIDVSGIQTGIYLVKLFTETGKIISEKVVIH